MMKRRQVVEKNHMTKSELEARAEKCFQPPTKCFFSLKPIPDGPLTLVEHSMVGEVPALALFGGKVPDLTDF